VPARTSELLAAGETAPAKRRPQREIGARLLISPRTVQYHRHKVFAKLGLSPRSRFRRALPVEPSL
jgi:DNA-binding CsgD family transcriptional regulator